MPTQRADASDTRRVCVGCTCTVHHGRPIVEITVRVSVDASNRIVAVRSVRSIRIGFRSYRYWCAIRFYCGTQVLSHPALGADLCHFVRVAVVVGHCGDLALGIGSFQTAGGRRVSGAVRMCNRHHTGIQDSIPHGEGSCDITTCFGCNRHGINPRRSVSMREVFRNNLNRRKR